LELEEENQDAHTNQDSYGKCTVEKWCTYVLA